MILDDYKSYVAMISKIFNKTKNLELSSKLIKAVIITSSIQNVLLTFDSNEDCMFSRCVVNLENKGFIFKNRTLIVLLFKFRNQIAHANNLIVACEVFSKVSMRDIDAEFGTIIEVCNFISPYEIKELNDFSNKDIQLKLLDDVTIDVQNKVKCNNDAIMTVSDIIKVVAPLLPDSLFSEFDGICKEEKVLEFIKHELKV